MEQSSKIEFSRHTLLSRLYIKTTNDTIVTLFFGFAGGIFYVIFQLLPQPFTMYGLFKIGFIPALAVIPLTSAFRGPIAGFLAGFIGPFIHGLVLFNTVVTLGLFSFAHGILGFVVGLATYDLSNGRSLVKLSVLSTVGLIFATLFIVVIGLFVEQYSPLVGMGFVLLPTLTTGIPTVMLITPILARILIVLTHRVSIFKRIILLKTSKGV